MAFVFTLILYLVMYFYTTPDTWKSIPFSNIYLAGAVSSFIAAVVANGTMLTPLQKSEKNFTPRIATAIRKSVSWQLANMLIFIYPLFSITSITGFGLSPTTTFFIWFIITGFTIDCYLHLYHTLQATLDPFNGLHFLSQQAHKHASSIDSIPFCQWIEALSDSGLKAISQYNVSVCSGSIREIESSLSTYLKNHSPIAGTLDEETSKQLNYTVLFTLQHLNQLGRQALNCDLEVVTTQLVLSLGKMIYSVTKYFPSLSTLPIELLGKVTVEAEENGFDDTAIKAELTLVQTGIAILEDDPSMEMPVKDIFLNIISQLELISNSIYNSDPSINLDLLTQTFHQIKDLFSKGKYSAHPDAGVIITAAENVIGTFDALEEIKRTMPKLSSEEK